LLVTSILAAACAPRVVLVFQTPGPTVAPTVAPSVAHQCQIRGNSWTPYTPITQGLFETHDYLDAQNQKVAEGGIYEVSTLLADPLGYSDLATADEVASAQVQIQPQDTSYARWIVLQHNGVFFVYIAERFGGGRPLSDVLKDPQMPCLMPEAEVTFVGYHALYFFPYPAPGLWEELDWKDGSQATTRTFQIGE